MEPEKKIKKCAIHNVKVVEIDFGFYNSIKNINKTENNTEDKLINLPNKKRKIL